MRVLEILLVVASAAAVAAIAVPSARRPAWLWATPWIAAIAGVVQVLVEGHRWPLLPLYALVAAIALATWPRRASGDLRPSRRGIARAAAVAAIVLWIPAVLLPWLLVPLMDLPVPTGPHDVGTRILAVVDPSRAETFTPEPDDRREIELQAWYPAQIAPGSTAVTLWEPELAYRLSRYSAGMIAPLARVPRFWYAPRGRVRTHAHRDAPVLPGREPLPVVLFSHGYGIGHVRQNTALAEELASHGYVVLSLGHAFETPFSVRPDGTVRRFDRFNDEQRRRVDELVAVFTRGTAPARARATVMLARDAEEQARGIAELARLSPALQESLALWVDDFRTVADHLPALNEADAVLAGRLDTARFAAAGMSFGGAAAARFCNEDPRCVAGIGLESAPDVALLERPLHRPFLFLDGDEIGGLSWGAGNRRPFATATGPVYRAVLRDTTHLDFTDAAVEGGLPRLLGASGPLDGRLAVELIRRFSRELLDRHLSGGEAPRLDGSVPVSPDVAFESRNTARLP